MYVHHTIRAHSVRVMRPFAAMAFVMLSVLCCVSRYGIHASHWQDVVTGFLLGTVMAGYIVSEGTELDIDRKIHPCHKMGEEQLYITFKWRKCW